MRASMQRIANDPPAFILRLHPGNGSWETEEGYNGAASITVHGVIAVIRGLCGHWSTEAKAAMLQTLDARGIRAVIGTHNGRLWIWTTSNKG